MHFHVVTLFKESIESYVKESIIGRAEGQGIIKVSFYDPRKFGVKKVAYVDGKPYGGGPGMVLQALPFIKAVETILKKKPRAKIIIFSPNGAQFTNEYARKLSKKYTDIVLISGRYEGIDARVKKIIKAEEVSVGPYVLTGGEIPAALFIDVISRQIKGVLGNELSLEEERISASEVYTRPETISYRGKNFKVPKVLLSGNRKKIDEWKMKTKSNKKTN